ncbi:hypothetical protein O3P69_002660 [Scylla paramamosain]|uniref:Uncharacterized protein n=1 Tax=Scylla paramamosain TaxID=85552 RepID=A0AAW0UPV7_SCYPA
MKEQMFCDDLDELFDVAHKDALIMMKNEEERDFLLSQHGDHSQSSMAGVDMDHSKSLEKKKKRNEEHERKKKSEAEKRATFKAISSLTLDASSSSSGSSTDESFRIHNPPKRMKSDALSASPSITKNVFLKPEVTAALDRTGVSHRKAMHQLGAQAKSTGIDLEQITLSLSTIYRYRKNCKEAATGIKVDITTSLPHEFFHLSFYIASSGREKAERIAILALGGDGVEFLLGVPKIRSSSGTDQANACLSAINDWGLSQQIKALVFDTTASNTEVFHQVEFPFVPPVLSIMRDGWGKVYIVSKSLPRILQTKILFQDQFSLTECELKALRDVSLFTTLCYVPF